MQAQEFCAFLGETLDKEHCPGIARWRTFAEADFTHARYGIIITTPSQGHLLLQVVAVGAAPGSGHGDPPPRTDRPHVDVNPTPVENLEAWVDWAVRERGDPRLRSLRRFSQSPDLGDARHPIGLEVTFHGSADWRVLVLAPFMLPAGHRPERHALYLPRPLL